MYEILIKKKFGCYAWQHAKVSSWTLIAISRKPFSKNINKADILFLVIDDRPYIGNPKHKNKIYVFRKLIEAMKLIGSFDVKEAAEHYPKYGFGNPDNYRLLPFYNYRPNVL